MKNNINTIIFPLALGGMALGTTEFMVMGLLPLISSSLEISIPSAGYLISSYAIGVMVGAPLIVTQAKRIAPKKMLLLLTALIFIFNLCSAFSTNYVLMLTTRFFSGLPHGAFFGIASAVVSKMAPKDQKARSISLIFSGLTISNILMVPLSTYLSVQFNWQYSFFLVSFISLLTLILIFIFLPSVKLDDESRDVKLYSIFKSKKLWLLIIITTLGFSGLFAWISYIAPLMTNISGFFLSDISWIMAVAGVGMFFGNVLGGYVTDKLKPLKATFTLLSLSLLSLLSVFLFSDFQYVSVILTFLAGLFSMSVAGPLVIMMMQSEGTSPAMGAALVQTALNMANFLGAFIGGLVIKNDLNYNYPALAGALLAGFGLVFCGIYYRQYNNK
ncbi:MFS transporter [Sphingobacterium siyangense]|uniref:DHA1 family arabinose polymer transporter-like MFS transporter n=1 Tax=Sphingobacterium siyangense TaxID=459529 RepID=A0A562LZK5_9SPHI|nr:MFS transporter [Sphingobacterium siyangense]TWI13050.1 DHA1 family arabinose polymer transporter-like MFS transporter [Sphingobacterium siyangense]